MAKKITAFEFGTAAAAALASQGKTKLTSEEFLNVCNGVYKHLSKKKVAFDFDSASVYSSIAELVRNGVASTAKQDEATIFKIDISPSDAPLYFSNLPLTEAAWLEAINS